MMSAISLEQLEASLSFWEHVGYVALASVIACCFGEYLHVKGFWHKEDSWWTKEGGALAALLLVVALSSEMFTQVRINELSGRIISEQKLDADITEERLLGERRLTANERWRLERVERTALPRSLFVKWPALVEALRFGKYSPICIVSVGNEEAAQFALNLSLAFSQAGNPARFLLPPSDPKIIQEAGSGLTTLTIGRNGEALAQMLWQKFQIGGSSRESKAFAPDWNSFPRDMPCIVVGDNNAALQPGAGQPGEGIDQYGGADPAPH